MVLITTKKMLARLAKCIIKGKKAENTIIQLEKAFIKLQELVFFN